jgi:hypothetical protein
MEILIDSDAVPDYQKSPVPAVSPGDFLKKLQHRHY